MRNYCRLPAGAGGKLMQMLDTSLAGPHNSKKMKQQLSTAPETANRSTKESINETGSEQ